MLDFDFMEYIENDLKVLRDEFKYEITCFIVDWAKPIKKAIEKIFPNSKIQRCLTHIKRQIRNNISNKPQSNCLKDLKRLITFKNFKNKEKFIQNFNDWNKKHANFLNERTINWNKSRYTHKKLRSSKPHIKNAIPYMFYYLEDENIKKSNNDLEWYNWVLDGHIFNHRDLEKIG